MDIRTTGNVAKAVMEAVVREISKSNAGEKIYVGADGEATYRIDDAAERAALEAMEGESVAVLSEEAGLIYLENSPDYICVLDPIDGSTNAVLGIPFYCTSIAVAPWSEDATLQDISSGVILNLVTGDLFEGEKDKGARLNGRKIIGPRDKDHIMASLYLKSNYGIIPSFPKVRAMGAVALELAHIAYGSLDCLMDNRNRLKVTDVAAGMCIVEEAGGVVSDIEGNSLNQSITKLEKVTIAAAGNNTLHQRILKWHKEASAGP